MVVIYRTAGGWGAGKGSNLVAAEVDGNFYDHDGRLIALENSAAANAGIETITQISPTQFTITLTNGVVEGPFTIPMQDWAGLFTGAWLPTTSYARDQMFTISGAMYVVLFGHVSATTFDPNANDGAGHQYYQLIFKAPAIPVYTRSGTTYTPTASDLNSYNRFTNASGCAVLLELDSVAGYPLSDDELHLRLAAEAGVFIEGVAGVTIHVPDGYLPLLGSNGAGATLKKIGLNEWDLMGLLTPTSP